MSPKADATQNKGPAPGQLFRVPKFSTQKRFIADANNSAIGTTLSATSQAPINTTALDRLDILKTLLVVINIAETYTNTGGTQAASPLFPYNWVQSLDVQFESAFKTFRQPGIIAAIMQSYRPTYGWKGVGMLTDNGANAQQGFQPTAALNPSLTALGLMGASVTQATTPLNLVFEIPLAFEFDIYWELDKAGNPLTAVPSTRTIVSPQYMSGTTRNVKPSIMLNPGMVNNVSGGAFNAPVTKASGDATSTFTGSATTNIFRDGWFAPGDLASVPPIYRWQYSRDFLALPTAGQSQVVVPLDSDPAGQGQILSLFAFVWDPALVSGAGNIVPLTQVATVELLFGSQLNMYKDTIPTNAFRWLQGHGQLLPTGCFGWDLALDDSGRLTNEFALNTLTTAGCQVRVTYNSGQAPSSNSTIYVGLEMLKAVSS